MTDWHNNPEEIYNAWIFNCILKKGEPLFHISLVQLQDAFFITPCLRFSLGVDGNTENSPPKM